MEERSNTIVRGRPMEVGEGSLKGQGSAIQSSQICKEQVSKETENDARRE